MDARVLELSLVWQDTVLDVRHHDGRQPVCLPGLGQHAFFTRDAVGWWLRLPHAATPEPLEAQGTLVHAGVEVRWRLVEAQPRLAANGLRNLDLPWLNTLLATATGVGAVLAVLVLYPAPVHGMEGTMVRPNVFTTALLRPAPRETPAFIRRLTAVHTPRQPRPNTSLSSSSSVPARAPAGRTTPGRHRVNAAAVVERMFGGPGAATVFHGDGMNDVAQASAGLVQGTLVANAQGTPALDMRGTGPSVLGLVGMHDGGTVRRGASITSRSSTYGGLAPRERNVAPILDTWGTANIVGALDRELIRHVVRQHASQMRYCYERALTANPGLMGKVVPRFTIGAEGHVTAVEVAEDTLGSPEATGCMLRAVRSWVFPRPKGGGVVVVSYPFGFRQAG